MRFAKHSESTEIKGSGPSGQNNIMFVKNDDPVEEENTVAAFKRSAEVETLNKQQRMKNDIEAFSKTQVKPKISVRTNPDFPITRKAPKKSKKGRKSLRARCLSLNLGRELRSTTLSAT